MTDRPSSDRFKSEMPHIPGVTASGARRSGAIVQGSDIRPPLGIEVEVRGKDILATRME